MPNLRCCKCGKMILSCIKDNTQHVNTINIIISRIEKCMFYYIIKPEICHNEIDTNSKCDGVFKFVIFEPTPTQYSNIDFLYYLKNNKLYELKQILLRKVIKSEYTYTKPSAYKSINSSSLCVPKQKTIYKENNEKLSFKSYAAILFFRIYFTMLFIKRYIINVFKK